MTFLKTNFHRGYNLLEQHHPDDDDDGESYDDDDERVCYDDALTSGTQNVLIFF
jgi:hypothetical protein